jgi:hypothetical protein
MKLVEVLKLTRLGLLAGVLGIMLSAPKPAFADDWGTTMVVNGQPVCDCTHPSSACECIDT